MALHSGKRLNNGAILWTFCVEHIPGHQDMLDCLLAGGSANFINRVEARFGKRRANIRFKFSERLPQLPVRGVDEFHRGPWR